MKRPRNDAVHGARQPMPVLPWYRGQSSRLLTEAPKVRVRLGELTGADGANQTKPAVNAAGFSRFGGGRNPRRRGGVGQPPENWMLSVRSVRVWVQAGLQGVAVGPLARLSSRSLVGARFGPGG